MSGVPMIGWLAPALAALFLYGFGQGLVKKYISEVPPARFCLYFIFAKLIVNLGFFFTNEHPDPFAAEGREFMLVGILSYLMDGVGWILYFQSIIAGPITIVGTLSAAYPALTTLFARIFLHEELSTVQYVGVFTVISACALLSYSPTDPNDPTKSRRWIPMAAGALLIWGAGYTIMKYSYSLPGASEVNMSLFNSMGGIMTLGVYGFLFGRGGSHTPREWGRSFFPMAMMAGGDLGVIIASKTGPISIVTSLAGAYPVVTLAFAWVVLKERITVLQWGCIVAIISGIFMCS